MKARREQQSGLFFVSLHPISYLSFDLAYFILPALASRADVCMVHGFVVEEEHTALGATGRDGAITIDCAVVWDADRC